MPNYPRIFAKFCKNPVVFSNLKTAPDTSGDTGAESYSAGTTILGNVQQASEDRIIAHAAEGAKLTHNIYFIVLPTDTSTGARTVDPTCRERDRFVANGRTFQALGPALAQGDPGVAWVVECEERT
jgi:hypothetical protein